MTDAELAEIISKAKPLSWDEIGNRIAEIHAERARQAAAIAAMTEVLQRIADMRPHIYEGQEYHDSDAAREVLARVARGAAK